MIGLEFFLINVKRKVLKLKASKSKLVRRSKRIVMFMISEEVSIIFEKNIEDFIYFLQQFGVVDMKKVLKLNCNFEFVKKFVVDLILVE